MDGKILKHGRHDDGMARDVAVKTALRTFPFRHGMPSDVLPDAPVFGAFEQVINPMAIDGRHDSDAGGDDTGCDDASSHGDDNATQRMHGEDASMRERTDGPGECDMHPSGKAQRQQYDDAVCAGHAASQAMMTGMMPDDGMGTTMHGSMSVTDGTQRMGTGNSTSALAHALMRTADEHDERPGTSDADASMPSTLASQAPDMPQGGGHELGCDLSAPRYESIIFAVCDAYASRDDGIGDAGVRAIDAASGWIDGDMSAALALTRHIDVARTAGIIGRDAVRAICRLWDVDGGIGDMISSARMQGSEAMRRDTGRGGAQCDMAHDAKHGSSEFRHRVINALGMLARATSTQSVCSVSFPTQYPDRPLLVPLCDGEYDADEWAGRQYWRKVPMHLGEDGRLHDDMWLTHRQERDSDGTHMIAVMSNHELVPQWCAWTEDLHVAGVALGMMNDLLIDGSGLLSLSIAECDGGDLMGTLRAIWEWCAAYVWYL